MKDNGSFVQFNERYCKTADDTEISVFIFFIETITTVFPSYLI